MILDDESQHSLLGLNIVVQNYGQVPISLTPDGIVLRFKTGATCRPTYTTSSSPSSSRPPISFLAVAQNGVVTEDPSVLRGMDELILKQWDFAVVGPCYFALLAGVRFEPDALEMCEELCVRVERADSRAALALEHSQYDLAQACEITGRGREIVARFEESRIWKHYTGVNSKFWVFNERPNLEV